jgi:thiamine-monophosphate kinase
MASEFEIIGGIARRFPTPDGVEVGIGDDAAVLESDRFDLVTTDMLVEDVHFRRDWCTAADIGWRALTASLSDIAAMGGRCGPYVANVAMTGEDEDFVDGILEGFEAAAEMAGPDAAIAPIGGDLSSSPGPTILSITLFGTSLSAGPILRSGAAPGDHIIVTGQPGRSKAGMALLDGMWTIDEADTRDDLIEAYRRPVARCGVGELLGDDVGANALIDVSDGLLADLGHIMAASGVGARLDWEALPVDETLTALPPSDDAIRRDYVLSGGEDFELLMSLNDDQWRELTRQEKGVCVHRIGRIRPEDDAVAWTGLPDGFNPTGDEGWEHFRKGSG